MSVISDMLGKWRLETRDNNFEQFLCCREVGWFLRKLMTSTTADVEYKLSPDSGTFTKITSSMGRSTTYDMPTEVKKIIFTYDIKASASRRRRREDSS